MPYNHGNIPTTTYLSTQNDIIEDVFNKKTWASMNYPNADINQNLCYSNNSFNYDGQTFFRNPLNATTTVGIASADFEIKLCTITAPNRTDKQYLLHLSQGLDTSTSANVNVSVHIENNQVIFTLQRGTTTATQISCGLDISSIATTTAFNIEIYYYKSDKEIYMKAGSISETFSASTYTAAAITVKYITIGASKLSDCIFTGKMDRVYVKPNGDWLLDFLYGNELCMEMRKSTSVYQYFYFCANHVSIYKTDYNENGIAFGGHDALVATGAAFSELATTPATGYTTALQIKRFTISFSFKYKTTGNIPAVQPIMQIYYSSTVHLTVNLTTAGKLTVTAQTASSTSVSKTSTATYHNDDRHYVTIGYDQKKLHIYVDDSYVGSTSENTAIGTGNLKNGTVYLGYDKVNNRYATSLLLYHLRIDERYCKFNGRTSDIYDDDTYKRSRWLFYHKDGVDYPVELLENGTPYKTGAKKLAVRYESHNYYANLTLATSADPFKSNIKLKYGGQNIYVKSKSLQPTIYIDAKSNVWESNMDADNVLYEHLTSYDSKFGSHSLLLSYTSNTSALGNFGVGDGDSWIMRCIPTTAVTITGPWTIDLWVKMLHGSADYTPLFSLYDGLIVRLDGIHTDSNNKISSFGLDIDNDIWIHFAVVNDNTNITVYLNGIQIEQFTKPTLTKKNDYFWIGGVNYPCLIDELRVSTTARWTKKFTPSTSAYTSTTNCAALVHFDV